MYVGVTCLGGRSVVCSLVSSSWFVCIFSFHSKVDASNSQDLYNYMQGTSHPLMGTVSFAGLHTECIACWILCLPLQISLNPSPPNFCPRRLTSMDLLAPMSSLFWLGSAKRKTRRQSEGSRMRERLQYLYLLPNFPTPYSPPYQLDCAQEGAAFLY